jgi:hypothetical protein
MDQVIDRIVRETSASFGLPPYWWKVDDSRTSYIVKLPVKRWRINWVVEQTEAWEREHAFATIVGKCSTRWIARDEFCPKLNIGVGTSSSVLGKVASVTVRHPPDVSHARRRRGK